MNLKQKKEYLESIFPTTIAGSYYQCLHDFKKNDPIAYELSLEDLD